MSGYVYILSNRKRWALYIGVTNNIARRIQEHKEGEIPSFTSRYGITKLVWYDLYERIEDAIAFEKRLKKWRRDWKFELIEKMNPEWKDLSRDF